MPKFQFREVQGNLIQSYASHQEIKELFDTEDEAIEYACSVAATEAVGRYGMGALDKIAVQIEKDKLA